MKKKARFCSLQMSSQISSRPPQYLLVHRFIMLAYEQKTLKTIQERIRLLHIEEV